MPGSVDTRTVIREVGCRFCGAGRGEACSDTRTGRPCRVHPSRIREAERHAIGDVDEHGFDEFDARDWGNL